MRSEPTPNGKADSMEGNIIADTIAQNRTRR